ncbi:MAG: sugar phosphate nucleotidyltransferase [Halococcoides sp.]
MKAVIPAAGQGTRLFPQTHTKPKPMVRVAGKPILGHILDDVVDSPIEEAVVVVGVMRETVIDYVTDQYGDRLSVEFVGQETAEGLGHAIYQARSAVDGDAMTIMLGDMLFEKGYSQFVAAHEDNGSVDGSIGVKPVDAPSNYGVVYLDDDGRIDRLVEKPADPESNLAISGIYIVEQSEQLFEALEYLIENDVRGAGEEFQLTDALQRVVEAGAAFGVVEVEAWYDCGRPETLLEANRVLLEAQSTDGDATPRPADSSVIVPPVDIGDGVTLTHSIVGPYVSIDDDATVEDCHVSNAILGQGAHLRRVNLENSLIGDRATVTGAPHELNVGDSSEIQL